MRRLWSSTERGVRPSCLTDLKVLIVACSEQSALIDGRQRIRILQASQPVGRRSLERDSQSEVFAGHLMAIGDPPNGTKPRWLGNQNRFVRFPWFSCHDTGASCAGILGGGNLELAAVIETREPHGTRERYPRFYSAGLNTHCHGIPFSLRFSGDRRRERRATNWRMNFVAVVIQTCKRAVFHVYGRSLFARDGILYEEK